MRSNDRLRALWRSVDGCAPTRGVDLDALAARISLDSSLALRARRSWGRWTRVAVTAAVAIGVAAAVAIALIPTPPKATLLGAVSGDQASAQAFEVAAVGPRDGAWVIAAAVGTDRITTDQ
jgi:hypothetical protein